MNEPTIVPTPVPLTPAASTPPASITVSERKQARRENWKLIARRPGFVIGSVILFVWIVCAIGGDRITPNDPLHAGLVANNLKPGTTYNGVKLWLGSDTSGRDILSRIMAGARDVLSVAPPAAVLGVLGGTVFGLLMGYYRGILDQILSRIIEALLSLPTLLIGLLAVTVFGKSNTVVIIVVAVLFTPIVARTVRAAVLAESDLDYVTSARLRGESSGFIMFREILPNVSGPIIVELTVRIGYAVFTVATLSFLGAGPPPPSPDWGAQVSESYHIMSAGIWWPTIFPAIAIASLVIAVNLIADAVQSVFEA